MNLPHHITVGNVIALKRCSISISRRCLNPGLTNRLSQIIDKSTYMYASTYQDLFPVRKPLPPCLPLQLPVALTLREDKLRTSPTVRKKEGGVEAETPPLDCPNGSNLTRNLLNWTKMGPNANKTKPKTDFSRTKMGGKNWGKYGNSTPFLVSGKSKFDDFWSAALPGALILRVTFQRGDAPEKPDIFFQCTSRRDLSNGANPRSNRALVVEIGTPKVGRQKMAKIPKYVQEKKRQIKKSGNCQLCYPSSPLSRQTLRKLDRKS